jgi:hypothetical protein
VRPKVSLPLEPGELTETARGKDDRKPSRFRIKKSDLEKVGYAAGCLERRAANGGTTAAGHAEECTRGLEDELGKIGGEWVERERERLLDYLEREENEKNRVKVVSEGEAPGAGEPSR